MKPIDPDKLLKVVEEKLEEQEEAERMSRERVTESTKTRIHMKKKRLRSLAQE